VLKMNVPNKTTETVREHGLYVTECCNVEVTLKKGRTFTRCPECERLTLWEFVSPAPAQLKTA
jgi:hypothetical protein